MGYDDYRDRVDQYWTHRNIDFDRKTDSRIAGLRREIERDNLVSGMSTGSHSVNDSVPIKSFQPPSVQELLTDLRKETNRMNAYLFESYRDALADELSQNEALPQTTRTHIPPLIRSLEISDTKTPEILQAHIDSIEKAVQMVPHIKSLIKFRLALADIKNALLEIQEVAIAYYPKP